MSVEPGFGGQKYIESVNEKIVELKKKYRDLFIQVDGGINDNTIIMPNSAGADSFVIGSYLTDSVDTLEERLDIINNILK